MKLRLLPPMLVFAVLLAGCGGSSSPAKLARGDVAAVGSQHITVATYDQALATERASLKQSGTAFPKAGSNEYETMQTNIVNALVQNAELAIEAVKLHVSVSASALSAELTTLKKKYFGGSETKYAAALKASGYTDAEVRTSIGERLLQLKLFAAVTKGAKATAAQVAAYYAANIGQYQKAASRKVREILAGKNKQKLAEQIVAQLKAGTSFATLAKRYSQDPGSKNSGGLFTATKGADVPAFDDAVFAASSKTGELLAPVDTPQYGWFVIQPLAPIVPATTTSEAKAAKSIRTQLDTSQQQQSFSTWLEKIGEGLLQRGPRSTTRSGTRPRPTPARRSPHRTRRPPEMALADALVELQQLTARLRRDCPWDRVQTERTIVPHTIEEAYEVADAALAGDDAKLLDELGDLLFQVYFLALLLSERGAGDLEAVARADRRQARRPPPARLRRRRGDDGRGRARELGAAQGRPGGARGGLPRRARDAAGAAARA